MNDQENIPFIIIYRNNKKVVKSSNANIVNTTREQFRTCPVFPKKN